MDLNLMANLKDNLPTTEQWRFTSAPGWYLPEDSEFPHYWDGVKWHDPAGELERLIADHVVPHLETAFKQGFVAGLAAAKRGES